MTDELSAMQYGKVKAYCDSMGYTNPQKFGIRWYAKNSSDKTVIIPFSVYKPTFPGGR